MPAWLALLPWLILLVFFLLAVFKSSWWWIPTAGLGVQRAFVWYRHQKPWWRIHDHALNVYTQAVAYEQVAADRERRALEINHAIALMVKKFHPDWGDKQASDFVLQRSLDLRREYLEGVIGCFLDRRPTANEAEKGAIRRVVEEAFKEPNASLRVRIAIAGIIEEQLGSDQRTQYLYQCVLGNV